MKQLVLGMMLGAALSALAGAKMAADKTVPPEVVVENAKVKMTRILLAPGERTPMHTHTLDHAAVIVQGSTMQMISPDGKVATVEEKAGEAVYVPANGRTHSLANAGETPLEIISIDIK